MIRYKRYALCIALLSVAVGISALGKHEIIPEGPVMTEKAVETTVFIAGTSTEAPALVRQKALGPASSAYLFSEFAADKKNVQSIGENSFSMRIAGQGEGLSVSSLSLYPVEVSLIPEAARSYIPGTTVEVDFPVEDIASGGKIIMQPSQKALVLGILKSGWGTGLARVKSLSLEGKRLKGVIELAHTSS
jgi:hypothetical protein